MLFLLLFTENVYVVDSGLQANINGDRSCDS